MHTPQQRQGAASPSSQKQAPNVSSSPTVHPPQESADTCLLQGSLPKSPLSSGGLDDIYGDLLESLSAGRLRAEVIERAEGLREPRDPDFHSKIASAAVKFEQLRVEQQNEILGRFFSSNNIHDRVAWTMPSRPIFLNPPPHMGKDAHVRNVHIAQSILATGLLPQDEVVRAAEYSAAVMPNPNASVTYEAGLIVSTVAATSAFLATPWTTATTVIGGFLICRALSRRPSIHREYVAGYLMEAMDAFRALQSGDFMSLRSTLAYYFKDPEFADTYRNEPRAEGFLAARALRLLGRSNFDLYGSFWALVNVITPSQALNREVLGALKEHDVTVTKPLITTFMDAQPSEREQVDTFIEALHTAHFAWEARDKENLRLEWAEKILAYDASAHTAVREE